MEFLMYTERNNECWRDVLSAEDRMRSIVGSTVNHILFLTFLKLENSLHLPSVTCSSENQVTLDVLLFKILHYYVNLLMLPLALKPKSAAFFSLKSGIA